MASNLNPYLLPNLDVLFVALNPPVQSNATGHYFSGSNSRFFHLLYRSGLITEDVPKSTADEMVFGSTVVNYRGSAFGIVDLVGDLVETDSRKVKPTSEHVDRLLTAIRANEPRFVCVIHSKVKKALNGSSLLIRPLEYGLCRTLLPGVASRFVLNYFPNGNAIADELKVQIFRELREALKQSH